MENEKKKTGYQSPWEDQLRETANKIINREKFSYDLNGDALYKQYKDRYTQQGRQAMMDTMGQAQAMTGGYGNSYAQSVGQQTYQGYMQGLTDKIPTLYQIALDKYTNEGNQMRDNMNLMMQQENLEYGRFRDQVGDQQWQDTFDYGKTRDEIADQQWRETFDYSKSRDQLSDQQNAYSKLMALMTGYGYKPSDAEMAAAGMSAAQRDAILMLGAYAPAPVYYEEEEPRKGAYVPPSEKSSSGGNTSSIGNGIADTLKNAVNNAVNNALSGKGAVKQTPTITPVALRDKEAWKKMKNY